MITARTCIGHGGVVPSTDAVMVGAEEAGTGPGRFFYACPPCVQSYDLVPYDQHPESSNGFPLRRVQGELQLFTGMHHA
jgi:hypothetical protein